MIFPEDDQYVFLVLTWGQGGEGEREAFGPYLVQADGSHLGEITKRAERWRAEHSDRPGMAAHLFATALVPPGGSTDLETVP